MADEEPASGAPAPTKDKPRIDWAFMGNVLQVIAALGLGAIAFNQWRNDQVLQLQEQWTSSEMQARRDRIDDALLCKGTPDFLIGLENSAAQEPVYLRMVVPDAGYIGLTSDVSAYLDFFRDADTCNSTGVCDDRSVCRRFEDQAAALQEIFGPYIARQQLILRRRDYGVEFQNFLDRCRPDGRSKSAETAGWDLNPEERSRALAILGESDRSAPGTLYYEQTAACDRMKAETSPPQSADG